ncbi:MAG: hypothetical protein LBQ00_03580, partial [Syntrophobacterales bacterium]|nr:hypothetical protein [Syntrophobacterales bacterium]
KQAVGLESILSQVNSSTGNVEGVAVVPLRIMLDRQLGPKRFRLLFWLIPPEPLVQLKRETPCHRTK